MQFIYLSLLVIFAACNGGEENQTAGPDPDTLENISDTLTEATETLEEVRDTMAEEEQPQEPATPPSSGKKENNSKKEPVASEESAEDLIIGKWQWSKTICCGRNARTYTDTLEQKRILHFKQNGMVDFYSGSKLERTENYKITYGTAYPGRPEVTIGEKTHGPALLTFENNNNRMELNYGWMDLQIEYYNRLR